MMTKYARTLEENEQHPCIHDEETGCIFHRKKDKVEWIKREYFEITEFFFCAVCDCEWERVNYVSALNRHIVITKEPKEVKQ